MFSLLWYVYYYFCHFSLDYFNSVLFSPSEFFSTLWFIFSSCEFFTSQSWSLLKILQWLLTVLGNKRQATKSAVCYSLYLPLRFILYHVFSCCPCQHNDLSAPQTCHVILLPQVLYTQSILPGILPPFLRSMLILVILWTSFFSREGFL